MIFTYKSLQLSDTKKAGWEWVRALKTDLMYIGDRIALISPSGLSYNLTALGETTSDAGSITITGGAPLMSSDAKGGNVVLKGGDSSNGQIPGGIIVQGGAFNFFGDIDNVNVFEVLNNSGDPMMQARTDLDGDTIEHLSNTLLSSDVVCSASFTQEDIFTLSGSEQYNLNTDGTISDSNPVTSIHVTHRLLVASDGSASVNWDGRLLETGTIDSPTTVLSWANSVPVFRAPSTSQASVLGDSQIVFDIDEVGNNLKVRVRYSNGTTKTGTVALS